MSSMYHIRVICAGNGLGADEYRAVVTQSDDTSNNTVVGPWPTKAQAKEAAEETAREMGRRQALNEMYDYDTSVPPTEDGEGA